MLEKKSKEGRLEGGKSNKGAIHAPKVSFVVSIGEMHVMNGHTRR